MFLKNICQALLSKELRGSILEFLKRILRWVKRDFERADRIYRAVEKQKQEYLERCLREGYPPRFF